MNNKAIFAHLWDFLFFSLCECLMQLESFCKYWLKNVLEKGKTCWYFSRFKTGQDRIKKQLPNFRATFIHFVSSIFIKKLRLIMFSILTKIILVLNGQSQFYLFLQPFLLPCHLSEAAKYKKKQIERSPKNLVRPRIPVSAFYPTLHMS